MIIGVPKEIKPDEYRVGMVPSGARALVQGGHTVLVEKSAGEGSGITDGQFTHEGAELVESAEEVWTRAEMIIKVKEPVESEFDCLREGMILYTFLHLAADKRLTEVLLEKGIIGVAYETVQEEDSSLPLLIPMSEIAGRMAIQEGAKYLEKEKGGRGILLGGVPGVSPGRVAILGGGIVGTNAAKMAMGLGARVTVLDGSLARLRYLDDIFGGRLETLHSNSHTIRESVMAADLLIGAVLLAGARAPRLVTRPMISEMKKGAVIVDVSVDQGGCIETSRPTSHHDPIFVVDGVTHYCVTNMPGAVPHTSTHALTNATFPYALEIASKGIKIAIKDNYALSKGINIYKGKLTCEQAANSLDMPYTALKP